MSWQIVWAVGALLVFSTFPEWLRWILGMLLLAGSVLIQQGA